MMGEHIVSGELVKWWPKGIRTLPQETRAILAMVKRRGFLCQRPPRPLCQCQAHPRHLLLPRLLFFLHPHEDSLSLHEASWLRDCHRQGMRGFCIYCSTLDRSSHSGNWPSRPCLHISLLRWAALSRGSAEKTRWCALYTAVLKRYLIYTWKLTTYYLLYFY